MSIVSRRARYVSVLRDFGDGVAEVGWCVVAAGGPRRVGRRPQGRISHDERNARRARSQLRRKVLAGRFDRLVTLTQRENVQDVGEYMTRVRRFVRLCQRRGILRKYVAVMERQARGALHVHFAVRGWVPVQVLRAVARRAGFDNVDISYRRRAGSGTQWKRVELAGYLAKYMAKECVRSVGGHRYLCSKGIEVPEDREEVRSVGEALGRLMRAAGAVGYVWVSDDGAVGWACSW